MTRTARLNYLLLILAWAPLLATSGLGSFPGRADDQIRRGNCTECRKMLELKVSEELPRLMLIRQRILSAVGRAAESEAQEPKSLERKEMPTTSAPEKRPLYKYKIISPAEIPQDQDGDALLRFKVDGGSFRGNEEAVGASLLLFVDRRRKIRKGGKGKKIFIEISKLNKDSKTWTSLTHLRTRIKKRRLKRIELPVNVAKELLHSDSKSLDLKVKCVGCGRLVQLVLRKDSIERRKIRPNKRNAVRWRKGRNSRRSRTNPTATPELIIRTRYLI